MSKSANRFGAFAPRAAAMGIANKSLLALLGASALSLAAPTALAQSASGPTVVSDGEDTIVVTARKREERLQDVPISLTYVGQEQLQREGIDDFQDLGFTVPNVAIDEAGGTDQTRISIRGIEGRAGIYLDEVFVTDEAGFATALIDIDRVEVLRGPQGTLFGRNNIAGVISLYSQEPGDTVRAQGDLTIGDYDLRQVRASIGGPLVEGTLYASLSGVYKEREGYFTNRGNGRSIGGQQQTGFRGQLLWTPTEALSVRLIADHVERDDEGNVFDYLANITPQPPSVIPPPGPATRDGNPFDFRVEANLDNFAIASTTGFTGRIDYDFGGVTLTSLTSSRESEQSREWDQDYTIFDIQSVLDFETESEEFSQELRLASNGAGPLEWVLGAYYFDRSSSSGNRTRLGVDFASPALGGLTLQQAFNFGFLPANEFVITSASTAEERQIAAFASATYDFTEQWAVTVGARYSREEQEATVRSSGSIPGFIPVVNFPADDPTSDGSLENEDFSPTVSVSYSPSSDATFYATFAQGFSSGGFNTGLRTAPGSFPRTFDPEQVSSYEVGLKGTLSGSIVYSAAAFFLDYQDRQVATNQSGIVFIGNIGEAEIQGFEAEATWTPIADLDLTAAIGYQDTEILTAPLAGKELPFAPDLTANLGGQYTWRTGVGSVILGGQAQYRGATFVEQSNNPLFATDALWRFNASLGWESSDGRIGLALQGFNLADEVYATNVDNNVQVGGVAIAPSDPRRVQLQLRARY